MPIRGRIHALPIGVKLSSSAIGVMLITLCTAVGVVSLQVWQRASEQGTQLLTDAAASTSALLRVYDETARRAALKDIGLFKREFDPAFILSEGSAAAGTPQPQLSNRGRILNGDVDLVDGFTRATGAVATVFARSGDDFMRITTSVKKDDGTRAVGTLLDRQHPAYASLLDGRPYTGRAVLFGKNFGTHYEPIRQGERTIGVLFVGTDLSDVLQSLAGAMQTRQPFGTGLVYAVDARPGPTLGQVVGLASGRTAAARIDHKDPAAAAFLKQLQEGGEQGSFDTPWSPTAASGTSGPTRAAFVKNTAWNWVVVGEAPVSRVMADARQQLVALWVAIGVAVLALLVMIVWLTRRLVIRPVAELTRSLSHLAQSDLSQPLASQSDDELGRLANAMEVFRHQLAHTMTVVRANAEHVASASTQIAMGNKDLSQRTEVQASALQETVATMDELSSTVRNNASNADQARQLALIASGVAMRGGQVVGKVVQTMKGIHDSSAKIAEINAVVDSIAFQTNILALNAAVEAARAGEQGRGFAVVATEVRNLAQRSATAAKQIKTLVSQSVEQVEQGTALVDQAGDTMGEIVSAIQRVSTIVAEISTASAEQSSGVNQVGQAVTQMDQATQQNAALVEESAAAAENLKQQADQLVQAVAVFRLDPTQARPGLTLAPG